MALNQKGWALAFLVQSPYTEVSALFLRGSESREGVTELFHVPTRERSMRQSFATPSGIFFRLPRRHAKTLMPSITHSPLGHRAATRYQSTFTKAANAHDCYFRIMAFAAFLPMYNDLLVS